MKRKHLSAKKIVDEGMQLPEVRGISAERTHPLKSFSLLDDVNGRITEVLFQVGGQTMNKIEPPLEFYKSLMRSMEGAAFHIAYGGKESLYSMSDEDARELESLSGKFGGRVRLHPMYSTPSSWPQDQYVALRGKHGAAVIQGEDGLVDDRTSRFYRRNVDSEFLKKKLVPGSNLVRTEPDELGLSWFEGGDVVSDSKTIFVGPDVLNQSLYKNMMRNSRFVRRMIEPPFSYWLPSHVKDDIKLMLNHNYNDALAEDEVWLYRKRDLREFKKAAKGVFADLDKELPEGIYSQSDRESRQKFTKALREYFDASLYLHEGVDSSTVQGVRDEIQEKVGVVSGGRNVLLLERWDRSIYHIDTHITPVGDNTVLVGDSRRGLELLSRTEREKFERWTVDFNREVAGELDETAAFLGKHGYRVERVPLVAKNVRSDFESPFMTYNNVLLEDYGTGESRVRRVYLPHYGFKRLDEEARGVYERLGFEVKPIEGVYELAVTGGSIRCASKVLRRSG